MERPKGKTLKIKEFDDLVQNHKMKEVAPPESARKDPMVINKAKGETIAKAAKEWMKAAKSQNPSAGFMEVGADRLDPVKSTDREMLYKGKKGYKE